MILRAAKISDIDDIMQIERVSFASAVCETRETFAKRIRTCKNCFLIFEDDAAKNGAKNTGAKPHIAGYFSAEKWRDIPESDSAFSLGHDAEKAHTDDGRVLYLSSFALLPVWRGRGVGKTLFTRSLEWFCANNDIDTFLLLVSEAWKGAVHIYEKAGFQRLRSIPDFFADDDGAKHAGLVMLKNVRRC